MDEAAVDTWLHESGNHVRVLAVSSWFPNPPDNGSKIRAYHLLRALAGRHDLDVISFFRPGEHTDWPADGSLGALRAAVQAKSFSPRHLRSLAYLLGSDPRSVRATYNPTLARLVSSAHGEAPYDVLVALQMGVAPYVTQSPASRVLDEVELSIFRDQAESRPGRWSRWRKQLTWAKTQSYVCRVVPSFDACTVVSQSERDLLQQVLPDYHRVVTIPNGVDMRGVERLACEPLPDSLVYPGALTYCANLDAVTYFVDEIWPRVRAERPSAHLRVTGRTDGVAPTSLPSGDGITLTGYLVDVRPTVAASWACIVPLRVGGGTRLKILEALALGTPVVATPKGAEGLDVTPEQDILIATDPAEFARQTLRLLGDRQLRERLSESGRRLVAARYDWASIGDKFVELIDQSALTAKQR